MAPKGQTALEYLLIVVVAIIVIVGVLLFLSATQSETTEESTCKFNTILCGLKSCSDSTDCATTYKDLCGDAATCDTGSRKCVAACAGTGGCVQCNVGDRQCASGTAYSICEDDPAAGTGCTKWGASQPCGTGLYCNLNDGDCTSAHHLACLGTVCTDVGGTETDSCTVVPNSCLGGGGCTGSNVCTSPGAKRCNPSSLSKIQTCQAPDINGCSYWQDTLDCGALGCSGGTCNPPACTGSDLCSEGSPASCSGTTPQTCQLGADSCWRWVPGADCGVQGKICQSGTCVCDNECDIGNYRCSGNTIQSCQVDSYGCRKWANYQACTAGTNHCVNGQSTCQACPAGVTPPVVGSACSTAGFACGTGVDVRKRFECKDTNGDYCYEWTLSKDCKISESGGLVSGGCNPATKDCNTACTDLCVADTKKCYGTGFVTGTTPRYYSCNLVTTSGCYAWSSTYSTCPSGTVCGVYNFNNDGNICYQQCATSAGHSDWTERCYPNEAGYCQTTGEVAINCGQYDSDPCLERNILTCTPPNDCFVVSGQATCGCPTDGNSATTGCSTYNVGDKTCVSNIKCGGRVSYLTCTLEGGADGCKVWNAPTPCTPPQVCTGATGPLAGCGCPVTTSTDRTTPCGCATTGSGYCGSSTSVQGYDGTTYSVSKSYYACSLTGGCPLWQTTTTPCDAASAKICLPTGSANGLCQCPSATTYPKIACGTLGAKVCYTVGGNNKYTECKTIGGCSLWAPPVTCDGTQICSSGNCICPLPAPCTDGAKKCLNEGSTDYNLCDNWNGDPCLTWSTQTFTCAGSQVCTGGTAGQCVGCLSDAGCDTNGKKRCTPETGDNNYQICTQASNGCYYWGGGSEATKGGSISCSSWVEPGLTCPALPAGSCGCTIVDQYLGYCSLCAAGCTTPGQTRCSGLLVQTCQQNPATGCLQWSTATSCPPGQSCNAVQQKCM